MEAKDLMVGIYVYFNCFGGEKIIVKLTGFENNIVYGISEVGSHWCNIEKVEPIKVTPEILEKNGFTKSTPSPGIHTRCYELDNKKDRYNLTITDYNKYKRLLLNVDSEDSECFNIKCDYVHELQHALHLCRIKKEIIL